MTPTDPVVQDRYKDRLDKTAFFSANVKVDLHQSIDIDRFRSISIGHCTVFLKKSLRKTHFGSFSAVSKAPDQLLRRANSHFAQNLKLHLYLYTKKFLKHALKTQI